MEVFCVMKNVDYEGSYIEGIFTSLDKAATYADSIKSFYADSVSIEKWTLDNPQEKAPTDYFRTLGT